MRLYKKILVVKYSVHVVITYENVVIDVIKTSVDAVAKASRLFNLAVTCEHVSFILIFRNCILLKCAHHYKVASRTKLCGWLRHRADDINYADIRSDAFTPIAND